MKMPCLKGKNDDKKHLWGRKKIFSSVNIDEGHVIATREREMEYDWIGSCFEVFSEKSVQKYMF